VPRYLQPIAAIQRARTQREARANFTLKLVRPGSGPAAELPTFSPSAVASRRLQFATRFCERHWRQPPRRFGFGTRDRPHSLA
jgi:hypothetical protein